MAFFRHSCHIVWQNEISWGGEAMAEKKEQNKQVVLTMYAV